MRRLLLPLTLVATATAMLVFLLPSGSAAANPTLEAMVGPGFTITLKDSNGVNVTHLDPGTYDIHVVDAATVHNFHLSGPGVNEATSVEETQTVTWTVTFTDGVYTFVCDPHSTQMKGSFAVGTATLPPPPPPPPPPAPPPSGFAKGTKLKGTVGPGFTISLKDGAGKAVKKVKAGRTYRISVADRSTIHDFHLTGPGVNKKTVGGQEGDDDLEAEVQEGDVPLRVRPAQGRHEGELQSRIRHETDRRRPVSRSNAPGVFLGASRARCSRPRRNISLTVAPMPPARKNPAPKAAAATAGTFTLILAAPRSESTACASRFALELDLAADRVRSLALSFRHCLP